MNTDFSLIQLVLNASGAVQAVMAFLILISLFSWTAIFNKLITFRKIKKRNANFEHAFWSGANLKELTEKISRRIAQSGPLERIFISGMREWQKLRERRISDSTAILEGAQRAMRASLQRELDEAESQLSFLASVGSVSPYIGLFGTVWGIMHAFTGFAGMAQVTLAAVAPGISEALVATAIGLFAAIPAVLAYNRFARDIDRITIQLETFLEEFSNILHRHIASPENP